MRPQLPSPAPPVLIAAAHGTRSVAGVATMTELVHRVGRARPGLDVRVAFVDVVEPSLAQVVADIATPIVVVPVLLSRGFHVQVDIPGVLASRDDAVLTAALGPDRAISHALADRLAEAREPGAAVADAVVLVATGSSDPAGAADLRAAAADLAEVVGRPVHVAVLSGPGATFADVVTGLGATAVEVAPYLLADGVFLDRLRTEAAELGVRVVAGPIGLHPALVELILTRYDNAARHDAARADR